MDYPYDPFQKQAIAAINQFHSVLVSAPTGAGKTAIAEYAIEKCLNSTDQVIYTAPIKAISNQKYRDFMGQYGQKVGILTGDVSINPDAQVLIMTTEIYRNQLFEHPEKHQKTKWVIFDEVHYLDDYERGTVWEEAIMFSHPDTRFLALSATAPNIEEIARWIEEVHRHPITVVQEPRRPVKLVHHFQCQNRIFHALPELKKDGFLGFNTWTSHRQRSFQRGRSRDWSKSLRARANSTHDLIRHLIEADRMPCLYFAFGRKRVEELAEEHVHFNLLNDAERERNRSAYQQMIERYDLTREKSAHQMSDLVSHGIAFHHAGMLPTLKEVVEQLFTQKMIRLIFTTETFALGINMPARTVVFDELRKFYGFGFDNLTTRDYYQMAGRAGRRNLDKEGYVYSRINPHFISFSAVSRVVEGQMEPIRSQFNASYATLLNLYRHLGTRLIDIYPKSLHHFQSPSKRRRRGVANIERKLALLEEMRYLAGGKITDKGEFASWLYGYELVLSELLEEGFFDRISVSDTCVLLIALVYEPRKNEVLMNLPGRFKFLEKECRRVVKKINGFEHKNAISPETRPAHFHLATSMEAWVKGAAFHELGKYSDVDEGILIRYFRMVIQLLRQLHQSPKGSQRLKEACSKALHLINRDIVDAEKLLRNV